MAKNILVISDNHGNISNLNIVLEEFKGQFDVMVHCGDSEFAADEVRGLVDCPVYLAEGNCDYDFTADREDLFEFEGHVCLVTHGHHCGVNWGEDELVEHAQEMGADIAFYGHTHVPEISEHHGVLVINPGSISYPRQHGKEPSYAVVEVDEKGEFSSEIQYF